MECIIDTIEPKSIIGIRDTVEDPGSLFETALPTLFSQCDESGIVVSGPPLGIYYSVESGVFDMAVALPVEGSPTVEGGALFVGTLPGGRIARATHVGSYDRLTDTWTALADLLAADGRMASTDPCWEEYVLGPESGKPPTEWRTDLLQPIAESI